MGIFFDGLAFFTSFDATGVAFKEFIIGPVEVFGPGGIEVTVIVIRFHGIGILPLVFGAELDVDVGCDLGLCGFDFALSEEFEHGEEQAEHFTACVSADEHILKRHGSIALKTIDDVGGVELDGGVIDDDFMGGPGVADLFHERGEGFQQIPDGDIFHVDVGGLVGGLFVFDFRGESGESGSELGASFIEFGGGVLEAFVGEKLLYEFEAGVGRVVTWGNILEILAFLDGEHHDALDFHERGGHDEELTGNIDIERFELMNVLDVLLGDVSYGDIVDVDLIAFDEVHKKVERAVKDIEFYAVILHAVEIPVVSSFSIVLGLRSL